MKRFFIYVFIFFLQLTCFANTYETARPIDEILTALKKADFNQIKTLAGQYQDKCVVCGNDCADEIVFSFRMKEETEQSNSSKLLDISNLEDVRLEDLFFRVHDEQCVDTAEKLIASCSSSHHHHHHHTLKRAAAAVIGIMSFSGIIVLIKALW